MGRFSPHTKPTRSACVRRSMDATRRNLKFLGPSGSRLLSQSSNNPLPRPLCQHSGSGPLPEWRNSQLNDSLGVHRPGWGCSSVRKPHLASDFLNAVPSRTALQSIKHRGDSEWCASEHGSPLEPPQDSCTQCLRTGGPDAQQRRQGLRSGRDVVGEHSRA